MQCYTPVMVPKLPEEIHEAVARNHGGPVEFEGSYVVMSIDVFHDMMGVGDPEEFAASVHAIQEWLEDVKAGKTRLLLKVLDDLGSRYEVQG